MTTTTTTNITMTTTRTRLGSTELRSAHDAIGLLASDSRAATGTFARLFDPGVRHFGPGRELCAATALLPDQPDPSVGFIDRSVEIHDLTQTGDRVLAQITFSGLQTDEFQGRPASNRRETADGLVVLRFEDGRIAEASSVLRWR